MLQSRRIKSPKHRRLCLLYVTPLDVYLLGFIFPVYRVVKLNLVYVRFHRRLPLFGLLLDALFSFMATSTAS